MTLLESVYSPGVGRIGASRRYRLWTLLLFRPLSGAVFRLGAAGGWLVAGGPLLSGGLAVDSGVRNLTLPLFVGSVPWSCVWVLDWYVSFRSGAWCGRRWFELLSGDLVLSVRTLFTVSDLVVCRPSLALCFGFVVPCSAVCSFAHFHHH